VQDPLADDTTLLEKYISSYDDQGHPLYTPFKDLSPSLKQFYSLQAFPQSNTTRAPFCLFTMGCQQGRSKLQKEEVIFRDSRVGDGKI